MGLMGRFERDCRYAAGTRSNMPRRGPPWAMRDARSWAAWSPDAKLFELCSGPPGLVTAGTGNNGAGQPPMLFSPDFGVTWRLPVNIPGLAGGPVRCISWGNAHYVGAFALGAFVSADGDNWQYVWPVFAAGAGANGCYFGGGVHVLLPLGGANNKTATSNNGGLNWVLSPALPVAATFNGGCYCSGLGLHLAVGQALLTGVDGLNWVQRVNPQGTPANNAAWSNDLGVAVIVGDGYLLWSVDAINWNVATAPAGIANYSLKAVLWTGAQFIASGQLNAAPNSPIVLVSIDGKTWREYPGYAAINAFGAWGIARSPLGRIFVVGSSAAAVPSTQIWSTDYLA